MGRDGYSFGAHGLSSLTIYPYDAILSDVEAEHHRLTENVGKTSVFVRETSVLLGYLAALISCNINTIMLSGGLR